MSDEKTLQDHFEDYEFVERTFKVDPKQEQLRIDKYVFDRLQGTSRNRIQMLIKAKGLTVNDKYIKSNYKVRPNDFIKVLLPKNPDVEREIIAEDIPLDIRYEDDYLMVIHKPAGLVVHPGVGNHTGTLVNGLVHYLSGKKAPVMEGNSLDRPGIVHRIDKDTSGLLVLAKEEFTMTHLAKQFYDHSIERTYQAIVWGDVEEGDYTVDEYIGRNPKDQLKMFVFRDRDLGKHAITHYKLLENLYYISLIECVLETGRTHQIRVHMQHEGHPIFSDAKYGGDKIVKGTVFTKYKQFVQNCFKVCPRQALHAKSLAFIHPMTGEKMSFTSELPEDMASLLEKWRHYLDNRKESFN